MLRSPEISALLWALPRLFRPMDGALGENTFIKLGARVLLLLRYLKLHTGCKATGKVLFALVIGLQFLCCPHRLRCLALLLEGRVGIKLLVGADFEALGAFHCSSKSVV